MSIHDDHRKRVRKRFSEEGLDTFNEHQVLEMLLFYCLPRRDTNEIAHRLINEFGSLSRVLEASPKELQKIPGIGEYAATFLSFSAALIRYYSVNKSQTENAEGQIGTPEKYGAYLQPYFIGRKNEAVFLLCLDAKYKVLTCKLVGEGSINSAGVPIRKIVQLALNSNATFVVLAHNHPSGLAIPSSDDINTTRITASSLKAVDVILADHIVFADDDFVSLRQSGLFDPDKSYTLI